MKKTISFSVCKNAPQRKPVSVYENLGSRIRKGLYEGIGEDHALLHGQFDTSDGSVDPLFQFRHPDVGVDKFERAVKARTTPSELRGSSAEKAVSSASADPKTTASTTVDSISTANNNSQNNE